MAKLVENIARFLEWSCASCGEKLVLGEVGIDYLGSRFSVELPKCEKCGLVMVPEELATGKMLEVEQMLEDK